jgi:hypothetical protein
MINLIRHIQEYCYASINKYKRKHWKGYAQDWGAKIKSHAYNEIVGNIKFEYIAWDQDREL